MLLRNTSMRRFLVTASVVPSSPILFTLMKGALGSSKTSVLTRATWNNIPEDTILHEFSFIKNEQEVTVTVLKFLFLRQKIL
jgi:hypothetical protein